MLKLDLGGIISNARVVLAEGLRGGGWGGAHTFSHTTYMHALVHIYIDSNIYSNPNPDQNENAPPPLAIRNIYRNNQKFNTKSIINVEFHAFPLLLPLQLYLPIKIPFPDSVSHSLPTIAVPCQLLFIALKSFIINVFFFFFFFYNLHKA